jgi:hypothetical protein
MITKTRKTAERPVTGRVAGSKPKPVTLDRVTYTDGWRRTRKRFAVERKRTQSAVVSGQASWLGVPTVFVTIGWVLFDRKESQIIMEPINPKRHLWPHVFETEREGKTYLKNTTLRQLQLSQLNRVLDKDRKTA